MLIMVNYSHHDKLQIKAPFNPKKPKMQVASGGIGGRCTVAPLAVPGVVIFSCITNIQRG